MIEGRDIDRKQGNVRSLGCWVLIEYYWSRIRYKILREFVLEKWEIIFENLLVSETLSWFAELIEYPKQWSLIYCLAEDYPDCLMLNFTIKLVSDAGFQVISFEISIPNIIFQTPQEKLVIWRKCRELALISNWRSWACCWHLKKIQNP